MRESGVSVTEIRYERLVTTPEQAAAELARALAVSPQDMAAAFGEAHAESVGRWQRDLTAEQLADVEAEAGDILAQL